MTRLVALFAIALALLMAGAPARAEEGPRVILILDASGSMRAKIDGKPKIDVAKQVVAKIIKSWNPNDEIGLVTYGHREKDSCDDIQVLREPAPLDAADFMAAVKSINPKGKTPMTRAVRMAAEALQYTEKRSTVILVSDGIENCGDDPCAVADELAKSGVGLQIHTVGFGLDDPAAADQLRCFSSKTGGISVLADNAEDLEKAIADSVKAAEAPPPAPANPPPQPAEQVDIAVKGHVSLAPGVELKEPYLEPAWEIHHAGDDGAPADWVNTFYGVDFKSPLDPGKYVVIVTSDGAVVQMPFEIVAGKVTELNVPLNAGIVRFTGLLDATTPVTSEGTSWEILRADDSVLATKYGPKQEFMLGAGDYSVRLTVGNAKVVQPLHIEAGKTQEIAVKLGAGQALVSAVFAPNGPAADKGLTYEVRKAEANSDGEHEWIATLYDPVSRFDLPAGKYLFVATVDYAKAELEAEVKAGQQAKVVINLNAGYLAVKAPGAGQVVVYTAEKDLSGERKQITYENGEQINRAFTAGNYHVVSEDANGAVLQEKDFEVKAGSRTEGTIP